MSFYGNIFVDGTGGSNLALTSGTIKVFDASFTVDNITYPAGTYLELIFTSNNTEVKKYINVTELADIDAIEDSDTIDMHLSNNQIKAEIKEQSIKEKYLDPNIISNITKTIEDNEKFPINMPTVNAFGGIPANTNLYGETTHDILEMLLFPYVDAIVGNATATPNGGVYEEGTTQTITQVSIAITKKSKPITSVALYNGSTLIKEKTGDAVKNGGTITFSDLDVKVSTDGNQLTVKVTYPDANDKPKTVEKKTAAFTFVYPYYYGVCAADATIDEALVKSLTPKIETKSNKTDWSFTCNNQRMVFAYPSDYKPLSSIIDPNGFNMTNSFERIDIQITGQPYYVYVNNASTVSNFKVDFKY